MIDPPPTYQESTSQEFHSNLEIVIAIDFGTTYSGVAFGWFNPQDNRRSIASLAEAIQVIKSWPFSGSGETKEKIPTVLSYIKSGTPLWGGYVKSYHPGQVRHFKLGLDKDLETHYTSDGPLFSLTTLQCSLSDAVAVDYASDFLKCLLSYVKESCLPEQLTADFLRNQPISYVLTVPAIWSDNAKALTREAAERAGIPPDRLELVTEPEAAALFCATKNLEMGLQPGDRFMVCDAGGGTVVLSPKTAFSH